MDEDVAWFNGHAIDPRINQFDLTNDNIGWCESQVNLSTSLIRSIQSRFTQTGETHDPLRQAFGYALNPFQNCTAVAWHYMGAEQLSRAHIGDPHAQPPLVAVPAAQAARAFAFLDKHLFGAAAWNVSPALLRQMVYTEWVTDLPQPAWAYNPPLRHDIPVSTIIEGLQDRTLARIFDPVLLQRLDDLSLKYAPGTSMTLGDAFTWAQRSVFGDLRDGRVGSVGEIHRSLQQSYARMLAHMLLAPAPGTPYDAQSLARASLVSLRGDIRGARGRRNLDAMTQAHLAALDAVADQALSARMVVPVTPAGDGG